MKKLLIIVLILIMTFPAFASSKSGSKTKGQDLYGTIGDKQTMEVEGYVFNNGAGIDLNIERASNNHRNLIAPTAQPCTLPGLRVGSFSLVSSSSNYTLEVFHDKLINQTTNDEFDYELALSYVLNNNTYTKICLGTAANVNTAAVLADTSDAIPKISIDLRSGDSLVVIQSAGIFFRLREVVNVEGTYESTVTFLLESET